MNYGLRIHQGSDRDGDLQRPVAQRRPPLDLNRYPALVVQPVHQRIDTAIEHRQEDMQPALRLHHQIDPHLPLDHLADDRRLGASPRH